MNDFISNSFDINKIPGIPRYRAIADVLRERILSGHLKDGDQLPSESQLSSDFGVNNRTLRAGLKLLADEHLISQCRGKGTFVTYGRVFSSRIVVLMGSCDDVENDLYLLRLVSGLSRAGEHQSGVELQFITSPSPSQLLERLQGIGCDGVIVINRSLEIAGRLWGEEFRQLPIVFLNPAVAIPSAPNLSEVSVSEGSTCAGIRLLYELGHRKIGFINGWGAGDGRIMRHNEEFSAVCEELGISGSYVRHVPVESGWFMGAREASLSLLSGVDRPTALFCPGFAFSCGAWQGVMDLGLRIPEDLSFLGFDANRHLNPLMSSLDAPLSQLSERALEVVRSMRVEGKHRKESSWALPRVYMPRGSCRSVSDCNH